MTGAVAIVVLAGTILCLAILSDGAARTAPPAAPPSETRASNDAFGGIDFPGAVPVSLLIVNSGAPDDRLTGASTPVAREVAIHRTSLRHGQRAMELLPEGLLIPADASLVLESGATHLMLVGLTQDLVQGQTFPLTLHFARAGNVTVRVRVRRKVDAAGLTPLPPAASGDVTVSLASAPPAAAG